MWYRNRYFFDVIQQLSEFKQVFHRCEYITRKVDEIIEYQLFVRVNLEIENYIALSFKNLSV
jgi:hypothetical protein